MIPVGAVVAVIVILVILGLIAVSRSLKVVQQYEKGIIYRFGRVMPEIRGPGLAIIRPIGDRMQKVNMQIVAMAVPAQEGITRDNVSVRVDAVVYFRVVDPIKATVNVQNYMFAISQQAQTSLRSIIGQSEMDQLLAERETVNRELRRIIDEPTEGPWGIRVERVEIKDVSLPEGMKRSMSRQAEAERERRARIITADGEYQASKRLAAAANVMSRDPAALQLQAAADGGRGGRRAEQHARHAHPGRAAQVLREDGTRPRRARARAHQPNSTTSATPRWPPRRRPSRTSTCPSSRRARSRRCPKWKTALHLRYSRSRPLTWPPRTRRRVGSMPKWEYATVPLLVHATKQILDNWGDDGWELVTVIPGPNSEQLVAYLKREKP